jgi:hypothetical protein
LASCWIISALVLPFLIVLIDSKSLSGFYSVIVKEVILASIVVPELKTIFVVETWIFSQFCSLTLSLLASCFYGSTILISDLLFSFSGFVANNRSADYFFSIFIGI